MTTKYVILAVLACSIVCLWLGTTRPILVVSKRADVRVLSFRFRVINESHKVSVVSGISELWRKNVALSALVAFVSIVVPLIKHLLLAFSAMGTGSGALVDAALARLARWSLIEPLGVALFIVLAKLREHLDVEPGPAVAPYLASTALTLVLSAYRRSSRRRSSAASVKGMGLLALCCVVSSCAPSVDLSVRTSHPERFENGDPVLYRGETIGKIAEIRSTANDSLVDIRLNPEWRGRLRDGTKGRGVSGLSTGFARQLELVGDDVPSRPLLRHGAIIDEATPAELLIDNIVRMSTGGATIPELGEQLKRHLADEALDRLDRVKAMIQQLRDEPLPRDAVTPAK